MAMYCLFLLLVFFYVNAVGVRFLDCLELNETEESVRLFRALVTAGQLQSVMDMASSYTFPQHNPIRLKQC